MLRFRGPRCRRGSVIVYTAVVMFVIIGFVGLAIDWGYMTLTAQKLQLAADAGAMAGAQRVASDPAVARSAAITMAGHNEAGGSSVQLADNTTNDAQGDVVIGRYDRIAKTFTPTTSADARNAVRVVARRTNGSPRGPLRLLFGPIFNKDSAQVARFAVAMTERGPAGPGIILLKSDGVGLQHSGDGDVTINGSVQINSPYKESLHQSGNGTLAADSYDVVGKIYDSKTGGLPGEWNESADPVPDPYAHLPVPVITDTLLYPIRSHSKYTPNEGAPALQPGRYKGGIELNGNKADYVLEPGIYIIEGGGFKIGVVSPGSVTMDGVMVYNTGTNDTTSNADQFYISADSTVTWTPLRGGTYDGFGLFYNRTLSDKKIQISGNGAVNISCIIYGKSAEVQLSGNGQTQVLGGGFVAASMQISGNGDFTVGGDTAGGPGNEVVYLIE